jgi:hypothetical protein
VSGYLSHATGCLDIIAAHRDLSELDTRWPRSCSSTRSTT